MGISSQGAAQKQWSRWRNALWRRIRTRSVTKQLDLPGSRQKSAAAAADGIAHNADLLIMQSSFFTQYRNYKEKVALCFLILWFLLQLSSVRRNNLKCTILSTGWFIKTLKWSTEMQNEKSYHAKTKKRRKERESTHRIHSSSEKKYIYKTKVKQIKANEAAKLSPDTHQSIYFLDFIPKCHLQRQMDSIMQGPCEIMYIYLIFTSLHVVL